jgi:hypothetical protein
MFLNNALAKWGIEKITSCTLLPIKADSCNTQEYISYNIIRILNAWSSRFRKEGAMLILPQVDRALSRTDKSRKHPEWRLCGSTMSNLSKTSGMQIKSFINTYYIHLHFSFYFFWRFILISLLRSIPALLNFHFERCVYPMRAVHHRSKYSIYQKKRSNCPRIYNSGSQAFVHKILWDTILWQVSLSVVSSVGNNFCWKRIITSTVKADRFVSGKRDSAKCENNITKNLVQAGPT